MHERAKKLEIMKIKDKHKQQRDHSNSTLDAQARISSNKRESEKEGGRQGTSVEEKDENDNVWHESAQSSPKFMVVNLLNLFKSPNYTDELKEITKCGITRFFLLDDY